MKLADRIEEVKSLVGYQHHNWRAEDQKGLVQAYSFWFGEQGSASPYEVRFLVVDKGLPSEWSICYNTKHIPQPVTTFKSVVETALTTFIANTAAYEKGWIASCDEVNEIAIIKAFEVAEDIATEKTAVVYKVDGNLTIRLLG